ncbi:9611_t:CDS:2 [Dentiscutata heterogama]|uniref:9611_t:CDS:1 n=1 Tax=Dentiscutata heterogama TaxID=1316150 RepID=A0ACA9L953_9GLOM|nr:9611_t:CDS:2 [Dentiscutata heterogama]
MKSSDDANDLETDKIAKELSIVAIMRIGDLCLKCKDMRFNANYWSVEEKETKVLEWNKHIKWAYNERENYK